MRSEDDVLRKKGKKIRLGEQDYYVKPMTMRKAAEWREQVSDKLGTMIPATEADMTPEALKKAVTKSPMELAAVLFSYMGVTPEQQEQILDAATEEEILKAFNDIMREVFAPFLAPRDMVTVAMNPQATIEMVERMDRQLATLTKLQARISGEDQAETTPAPSVPPSSLQ